MARCLIVGCGCRGLTLARALRVQGHAVRATTRRAERLDELEAAGVEAVLGDPDRVATLAPALEHVGVAMLLLGSATGDPDQLAALHGTRLDMLLTRMLDSTVRGIVYETEGTVEPALLHDGARRIEAFCDDSSVPYVLLGRGEDFDAWLTAALRAVDDVLAGRPWR